MLQNCNRSRILAEFMLKYRAATTLCLKHIATYQNRLIPLKGKHSPYFFVFLSFLSLEKSEGVSCHCNSHYMALVQAGLVEPSNGLAKLAEFTQEMPRNSIKFWALSGLFMQLVVPSFVCLHSFVSISSKHILFITNRIWTERNKNKNLGA